MPGGFPLGPDVCNGISYGVSGGIGTAITPSASANTKGSYTQIIAATTYDACLMEVVLWNRHTATNYAADVAIGASDLGRSW